jgi:hypothetical protein
MTNFLMRRARQHPVTEPTQAAIRQEEFANAVAAFRKATGKADTRNVPCRCAVIGEPFVIVFERMSPAHRFQIARIERDEETGSDRKTDGGFVERKPEQRSYDAGEFDWTGVACPHCDTQGGFVYCDQCGETVCSGRVRRRSDGTRTFTCHDQCGATGTTGPATHVRGGAGASRPGIGHAPQLPPPSAARRSLPDGAAPLLPGRQSK